jgi:formylglycine-generating enzyme required for sulfatase activity
MKKHIGVIGILFIVLLLGGCIFNSSSIQITFLEPGDYGTFTHGESFYVSLDVTMEDESDYVGTIIYSVDNVVIDTFTTSPYRMTLLTGDYQLGEHVIKAVAEQDGENGNAELHFTLTGNAPEALFTVTPTSATTDSVFYFSAEESNDVENTNDEMTYEWDFNNDGEWDGVGMKVFHQFHQTGNYTVRLKVTDSGGLETETTNQVNVTSGSGSIPDGFSLVEAGSFRMSYSSTYQDVILTQNYFISQHEVSIEEYMVFLSDHDVNYNPALNGNILMGIGSADCPVDIESNQYVFGSNAYFESDECPVAKITWYGALEYCNWLSEEEGLTPCYSISQGSATCSWMANGYRLPTEAEWEFAAKGGIRSKENYDYAGSDYAPSVAVYNDYSTAIPTTAIIESKLPNELGLHDMTGNVCEWCWDIREDYFNGSVTDPKGGDTGSMRVFRGGAYSYGEHLLSISKRENYSPISNSRTIGFRVVRLAQ